MAASHGRAVIDFKQMKNQIDLVRRVRQDPFVSKLLEREDPMVALRDTEKGAVFLDTLGRFLAEFGHTLQGSLLDVSWVEDPSIVLAMI